MTVSKVLNDRAPDIGQKTRARVLKVAKKLNYHPHHFAQLLKKGRTNIIGISGISGTSGAFEQSYQANIYSGISTFFSTSDYRLIFHNTETGKNKYPYQDLVEAKMVDGIILLLLARDIEEFEKKSIVKRIQERGVPFVVIHSLPRDLGCVNVSLDTRQAGAKSAEHLIQHGYRSVGLVLYHRKNLMAEYYQEGYTQVLRKHGIRADEQMVYDSRGVTLQHGYAMAEKMLAGKEMPRALLVHYDEVAFGMIQKFREAGVQVPEDIALVSFRNDNLSALTLTGLTTINEPAFEKGEKAGQLLVKQLNKEDVGEERFCLFEPELIIRTSCGCKQTAETHSQE
jgi:LacI family transcriptional regulator